MRRPCVALLVALVLIFSLEGIAAPADLGLINEVLEVLRTRHWNPNLDLPALVRAGVGGLREALQRNGIDANGLQEIPTGADRAQAVAAFGDRLDQAAQRAAGRVSERDLLYAGLRAMLSAVGGSHTHFLAPTSPARSSSYTGIGIQLRKSGDQWIIGGVAPYGPADTAGVRPGDVLVRVRDVVVATLASAQDVAQLILGDEGTTVQVTLRRKSTEQTLSIVRQRVVRPMVESWMLVGRIGYLKLYYFSFFDGAASEIRAAVVRLLGTRPRALIVDLRENGGGSVRVFLDTMSLFLPSGTKVAERSSRSGITQWTTTGDPIVPAVPMVVLIGPGSASGGELMAAALKERREATLVGSRTAGELEQGNDVRLSDGSMLEVSVARIRTSTGVEIEGRGYPPDVEVSPAASGDQDLQMERAIQIINQRLQQPGPRAER